MREKIKSLIAANLGLEISDIEEESSLKDLGLETATLAEVLENIKEKFDGEIPEGEVQDVRTVGELLDLAEQYVHDDNE